MGGARPPQILIYAHFSEGRDGVALLETLAKSLMESGVRPQYIIFTTYQERQDGAARIGKGPCVGQCSTWFSSNSDQTRD